MNKNCDRFLWVLEWWIDDRWKACAGGEVFQALSKEKQLGMQTRYPDDKFRVVKYVPAKKGKTK